MAKKAKKKTPGCKHDGDMFPLNEERSLIRDPILGWVVEVMCGKCNRPGVTNINPDPKAVEWDEPAKKNMDNDELHKLYGPFRLINRVKESDLLKLGKWQHILTIGGMDSDKSEDGWTMWAEVGHHLVNVEAIYESTNPMPPDLTVDDFWFDDEFIKAP